MEIENIVANTAYLNAKNGLLDSRLFVYIK